ncbi:sulfate ABC transporter permease [Halococcoides cellulosivorans]|uniref:Sulfate ABC transporter permease n=1 Tax=Halococcoides cellulosivorans TaxID=1679096 RepID=A0A2R4X4E6_9EURY|nr:sulfate ABC transporter permease [Halococcoides cellulosivorans]
MSQRSIVALLGAVLVVYLVVPLVSFLASGGPLVTELGEPATLAAVRTSLVTAPVTTLLATVFGVPLAYTLARYSFPGKRLVEALVVLPLVIPPVVGGVMLLTAVGPGTLVGRAAAAVGISITGGYAGIVLAQTFVAGPFLVVVARSGFAGVDPTLERAARSLGRGPIETALVVTLPLAKRSILAGIALTFARALGEFGATMTVAYHPHSLPTRTWVAFVSGGVEATLAPVAWLLGAGLAIVIVLQWLGGSVR